MGIFSSIMGKIFGHPAAAAAPAAELAPAAAAPEAAPAAAPAAAPVDVGAVLRAIAAEKGDDSNWDTSIVDLLKLLDMDSSLDARKTLADELNVHAGEAGTAEENIALHQAVLAKLAENGGKVPDNLKG